MGNADQRSDVRCPDEREFFQSAGQGARLQGTRVIEDHQEGPRQWDRAGPQGSDKTRWVIQLLDVKGLLPRSAPLPALQRQDQVALQFPPTDEMLGSSTADDPEPGLVDA